MSISDWGYPGGRSKASGFVKGPKKGAGSAHDEFSQSAEGGMYPRSPSRAPKAQAIAHQWEVFPALLTPCLLSLNGSRRGGPHPTPSPSGHPLSLLTNVRKGEGVPPVGGGGEVRCRRRQTGEGGQGGGQTSNTVLSPARDAHECTLLVKGVFCYFE